MLTLEARTITHYIDSSSWVHIEDFEENEKKKLEHDSLLNIENSRSIKTKERSSEALNKSKSKAKAKAKSAKRDYTTKRQRAFENSTRRESSEFEYAEIIALTSTQSSSQVPASQYIMMPSPSSQIYSMSIRQEEKVFPTFSQLYNEFTSTVIAEQKRGSNNQAEEANKRARK